MTASEQMHGDTAVHGAERGAQPGSGSRVGTDREDCPAAARAWWEALGTESFALAMDLAAGGSHVRGTGGCAENGTHGSRG